MTKISVSKSIAIRYPNISVLSRAYGFRNKYFNPIYRCRVKTIPDINPILYIYTMAAID